MARSAPTFEVRFVGPGIDPSTVPLRSVADALQAIQEIASGRDRFDDRVTAREKSIGLVKVRKGSAVYGCLAHSPVEAKRNLSRVGRMLGSIDSKAFDENVLAAAIGPIETLSNIAKTVGCRIEINGIGSRSKSLLRIDAADYQRTAARLFVEGETTISGTVQRIGGAYRMRCAIRIPGRHRLLHCQVETKELVQKLGVHLYQRITATGHATWIQGSWRICRFRIKGFEALAKEKSAKVVDDLRDAGLDAWDTIDDPEVFLESLR